MDDIEKLQKILPPTIKISKTCLSYVNRLFPEFKDSPCILLHKEQHLLGNTQNNDINTEYNNKEIVDDEYDITGSPLEYSFPEENNFDETMIVKKQCWYTEEEKYLPLSRIEACNILNLCLEHLTTNYGPLFILCDGMDAKKSRLLGTMVKKEWFTTIEVLLHKSETFDEIEESSDILFQQHLNLSRVEKHDVTISAFNTFDLMGTKAEMIDCKENKKNNFVGSMSLEVDSCSLSLNPSSRSTKKNLVLQVITEFNSSLLKELWKQLLLLNQYLTIMEKYKQTEKSKYGQLPMKFPDNFTSPYAEEHKKILENVNLLLHGDHSYRNSNSTDLDRTNYLNEENVDHDFKLEQYVNNLPFRYNLDFTDCLWELLIQNTNYFHMRECIHTVLQETASSRCLSQLNFANTGIFAQVMVNPLSNKSDLMSNSSPLLYTIDMGFKKLSRDYIYILRSAKFGELNNLKQLFENASKEFDIDAYRKKLLYMAQIHLCLEFMLFVQSNVECLNKNLGVLFSSAVEQFTCEKSPMNTLSDLNEKKIYTLTAPLPNLMFDYWSKEIFATRRISLSSQSNLSQLKTTNYYSQLPIFPTSIHSSDDLNMDNEEIYHVISVTSSSIKVKNSNNIKH